MKTSEILRAIEAKRWRVAQRLFAKKFYRPDIETWPRGSLERIYREFLGKEPDPKKHSKLLWLEVYLVLQKLAFGSLTASEQETLRACSKKEPRECKEKDNRDKTQLKLFC